MCIKQAKPNVYGLSDIIPKTCSYRFLTNISSEITGSVLLDVKVVNTTFITVPVSENKVDMAVLYYS